MNGQREPSNTSDEAKWKANILIEKRLIANLIFNGSKAGTVLRIISAHDFYDQTHITIAQAITDIFLSGDEVNLESVVEATKRKLPTRLFEQLVSSPTDANIMAWQAKQVLEYSNARKVHGILTASLRDLTIEMKNAGEVAAATAGGLLDLSRSPEEGGLKPMSDDVPGCYERSEAAYRDGDIPGIKLGLRQLEKIIPVLEPQTFTVIAADSGIGKTSFAMNIITRMAKDNKRSIIYSLEMGRSEMMYRILASEMGIPMFKLKQGALSPGEWARYAEVCGNVKKYSKNMVLASTGRININSIVADIRIQQKIEPIDLVLVDYIQLLAPKEKGNNDNEKITAVVHGLKAIAQTFGFPVIGISQYSRGHGLADLDRLRGSGSIGHDADNVIAIERPPDGDVATFRVIKQRNGPVGNADARWIGHRTEFIDL